MSNYSKLIGGIVGNVVGLILAWVSTRVPGIAECSVTSDVGEVCTVLGFSQIQITAAIMMLVNGILIHQFPANKPA